jgi:hypothetical protein
MSSHIIFSLKWVSFFRSKKERKKTFIHYTKDTQRQSRNTIQIDTQCVSSRQWIGRCLRIIPRFQTDAYSADFQTAPHVTHGTQHNALLSMYVFIITWLKHMLTVLIVLLGDNMLIASAGFTYHNPARVHWVVLNERQHFRRNSSYKYITWIFAYSTDRHTIC